MKLTKARKQYTCTNCTSVIAKGAMYYRHSYPFMHGCSPEKQPDDIECVACVTKHNAIQAERVTKHNAIQAERWARAVANGWVEN